MITEATFFFRIFIELRKYVSIRVDYNRGYLSKFNETMFDTIIISSIWLYCSQCDCQHSFINLFLLLLSKQGCVFGDSIINITDDAVCHLILICT